MSHARQAETWTKDRRQSIVTSIARRGHFRLPDHILELTTLLTSPTIDLSRVSEILDSDPRLALLIIRLANFICPQQDSGVTGISQAIVLLGAEFLHKLVLTFALMESTERQLPANC